MVLAGCAGARPDLELPGPRSGLREIERPRSELVEPGHPPLPTSVVWGDIRFAASGGPALDLGPAVVYLRPRKGWSPGGDRASTARIVSQTPEFAPELTVVRPGQEIVFVNDGPLVHRLFSPDVRDLVLEIQPGSRSQRFSIRARGPARFFCSLHAAETFVVFAETATHVAVVSEDGRYRFTRVAAGRYTLGLWSERVAGPVRQVAVNGYTRTREPIWLFADLIEP